MTAPQPQPPVDAPEERIGKYRVHPVAAMFPMMAKEELEELAQDIWCIRLWWMRTGS